MQIDELFQKQAKAFNQPAKYQVNYLRDLRLKRIERTSNSWLAQTLAASTPKQVSNVADFQYYTALNRSKEFSVKLAQHLDNRVTQRQQQFKQVVERLIALIALVSLSPALLVIALAIYIDNPGPVLYKSNRVGRNHEMFGMFKFRTMNVNADAQRDALRSEAGQEGQLFKLKNDPRVTRLGNFLRRFSIDEIPQLLNVVRGEMSLIGPRPLPADESGLFAGPFKHRFDVLPGLTGIWQVKGRSNTTFSQLCLLELNYLMNWNLLEDLKIIGLTIPAVLKSKGAY